MAVANAELRFPFSGPERLALIKSKWFLTDKSPEAIMRCRDQLKIYLHRLLKFTKLCKNMISYPRICSAEW